MPEVSAPSGGLLDKMKALNVRRNQDWARFGASIPAAVAAGLRGEDAAAAARGFYPDYSKGASTPMQVAAAKKDVIDAMVAADQKRRSDKVGLVEKLRAQDDVTAKLIAATQGTVGDIMAGHVEGGKARMQQRTTLLQDYSNSVLELSKQAGGNQAKVEALVSQMTPMLTPDGVSDPNFGATLTAIMNDAGVDQPTRLAFLLRMEAAANGIDAKAGDGDAIGGLPGIIEALRANGSLDGRTQDLVREAMAQTSELETRALGMATELTATELLHQKGVGPGSAKVQEIADLYKAAFSSQDPAKALEEMEKLLNLADPAAAKGDSPDAKRYADLLDSMDSESAPANLQEARRRLIEDPEFQSWMKANGFQDPGMALKELRRLLRERAHGARKADADLVRDRREAQVGPQTGPVATASSKAAARGVEPAQPSEQGPLFVMNDAGVPYFYGGNGEFRPATAEEMDKFDALAAESPDKAAEGLLGPDRFAEFERLAKGGAKPAAPAAPPAFTIPHNAGGPSLGSMREDARYRVGQMLTRPGEGLSDAARAADQAGGKLAMNVGQLTANILRARLKRKPTVGEEARSAEEQAAENAAAYEAYSATRPDWQAP